MIITTVLDNRQEWKNHHLSDYDHLNISKSIREKEIRASNLLHPLLYPNIFY